jgi:IS605 OrfB family transposase
LRDEWVKSQPIHVQRSGLQARQWKMALDEVFYTMSGYTEVWKKVVIQDIKKNEKITEIEQHYLFYILCFHSLIYDICKDHPIKVEKEFSITEERKLYLNKYLHNLIRKRMGRRPLSKSLTFTIDPCMYDVKKDKKGKTWISITSLIPNKRVKLQLTDDHKINGNLTVKILKTRIEIIECEDVMCKRAQDNISENVIAFDKGITNLINSSSEKKYGRNFGKSMNEFSDRRKDKGVKRNRLDLIKEKHILKGKLKKVRNIMKFNLGHIKYDKITEIERKELERQINEALNNFLKCENIHTLVVENLNFCSWKKYLTKDQKRRFSAWLKGYLRERIEYKCQQNGVLLAEINAAYTSQTCPFCGYVHSDNRMGSKFHCLSCGREGDADYFASLNILSRCGDPDIGLYTPYKKVKEILMERYEERCRCGSTGEATVETVQPRLQKRKRRVARRPSKSESLLNVV